MPNEEIFSTASYSMAWIGPAVAPSLPAVLFAATKPHRTSTPEQIGTLEKAETKATVIVHRILSSLTVSYHGVCGNKKDKPPLSAYAL